MNRQVTSSDINRSRIHLRGGKRVRKTRGQPDFHVEHSTARKFTVVSREASLVFLLFLFSSSSPPSFLSFFLFLRKRKGSRSVRVDLLLHGRERGTNLSRDEISLENEVDDHVNRFSSILFYVCSILTRNQRQDLRPPSRLPLRLIHIQVLLLRHFQLNKLVKIYIIIGYRFRY